MSSEVPLYFVPGPHLLTNSDTYIDIDSLESALKDVVEGRMTVLPRMRLSCTMRDVHGTIKKTSDGSSGLSVDAISSY